jgi:retron-type reverse transcriptase
LSSYFDTIPHNELLQLVGLRISDGRILHLLKMWLKAPIWEDGKTSGGKGNKVGTPQGGVISPLLANIFLNLLDKAVKRIGGVFQKAGVKLVRYADDCAPRAHFKNIECDAVQEMRVGPSKPTYRSRLQTTTSCVGQEPR